MRPHVGNDHAEYIQFDYTCSPHRKQSDTTEAENETRGDADERSTSHANIHTDENSDRT